MRSQAAVVLAFLCSACTVPRAVEDVSEEGPPPALGRPGWVRASAGLGAWLGAIGGAAVSIVTLPITFPVTLIADEPLGYAEQEFLFFPVTMGASAGHFLLGAPTDTVDFVFRRAWVGGATEPDYDFTPMPPPAPPAPPPDELLEEPAQPAAPDETPREPAAEASEEPPPAQAEKPGREGGAGS